MLSRQDLLDACSRTLDGRTVHMALAIGVDRFARLRNAIGFRRAEEFIGGLSQRLQTLLPDTAMGRIAPDAFGVVLSGDLPPICEDLAALRVALERPIDVHGHAISLAVRIGYSLGNGGWRDADALLPQAEMALDQAREEGVGTRKFPSETGAEAAGRLSLLDDLRDGLERGELELHYQPQVRTRTGEIVSVEALLRWNSPVRGRVPPDAFIGIAEETGLIRPLTEWVIARANADARTLKMAGHEIGMSVNISTQLLCDTEFVRNAVRLLDGAPGRMTFEITETAAIRDWEVTLRSLRQFADMGVRLAIDDYGSGMSSLAYVQQLPAHELKIDKQFITHITNAHRDPLLVRSTIELGHALEFDVVAEGVEDAATLALVTIMGCDLAQGYYLGRPMPLSVLLTWLNEGRRAPAIPRPLKLVAEG
jgi:EAL domain-containing protein (putative c-di-GMP-specific phosphodiesterase class I)